MRRALIPLLAGVMLAGCSSPEPRFYALAPVPGAAAPARFHDIEIRRPGLAGYLDRSDVVLRFSGYQLGTDSQVRWASPLGEMIGRILAQNLAQRLPGAAVYTDEGAISADPDARVEVDIRRFDPDASGNVVLDAAYAIERGSSHRPLSTQTVRITEQPSGAGAAQQAAAMSRLLGTLADDIAVDLRRASGPGGPGLETSAP